MKKGRAFPRVILTATLIYLLIPLLATLLYSVAKSWQNTILPESWTLGWFRDLFMDPRFTLSLWRTLWICFLSVGLSVVVMLPTIFIVVVYLPRLEKLLNVLVLIPYAAPGVVMAVGLIKLYSSGPVAIAGTMWILVGVYFVAVLPYMYQGIRNSMRTIRTIDLIEAAELLGASKLMAFRRIIVPNVLPGIRVSVLLSFSILFGEFVLANLLVGGQFETIQIYLYHRLSESGHLASAVVICYFLVILILSGILLALSGILGRQSTAASKKGSGQ
ncbi:ABC transporter permease subunit [Paenibacillus zeisoli]|uniref:ABC transporter permease subunit n=1 Tax=Paenibacillus zeisoli TaxID=2496267 RepID=A0A3S1JSQ4_9BACL|nr:ABC transporter permease subunit [Paenibacillus zeisoli]RUT35873.1 ABC transporter permease subunit [Paenibacillus zeisoli]